MVVVIDEFFVLPHQAVYSPRRPLWCADVHVWTVHLAGRPHCPSPVTAWRDARDAIVSI